jgi:enoyl-CoA hydratase
VAVVEIEHPESGITRIVLARPERLNAINFELVGELHDALDEVALDDSCRVVVVTGSGRAFCSGLDLKDWGPLPAVGEHPHRTAGSSGQSFMSSVMAHVRATPQIVIASVNGLAYGGGLALALACDLRLAGETSSYCAAFIRTGLSGTDMGVSYFLPRLIGASRAFDMMVTGRAVGAEEAQSIGLVSRIFDDDLLVDATMEVARTIAGYTAVGLRLTKEAMWANLDATDLTTCLALENRNQDLAGQSIEVKDYMVRYRERVTSKGSS